MCASKIGRIVGVGEGVGDGDGVGVGLGVGEATATVAVALGDGELAAGCPHEASNTTATSNTRAITL
jgi:transketolase N-terminal domain/subunit